LIPILVVAGPTAAGKTELAISLACALRGEIISADSRQIYKGLDIGTGKPSPVQLELVKHHLIDIVDPAEKYSAGKFAKDASAVARKLSGQGKTILICGGTGFYIEALIRPFFKEPASGEEEKIKLRLRMKQKAEAEGTESLYQELSAIDPQSARRLHPNDFQRVSRALELYYLTGQTMTELLSCPHGESPYAPFSVILEPERESLKRAIACRCQSMLERGWAEEVEALLKAGISPDAPGMQSLGYREVIAMVRGKISRDQALALVIQKTWQYARRQYIWFNRRPAHIRGNPGTLPAERIVSLWRTHSARFS